MILKKFALLIFIIILLSSCRECAFKEEPLLALRFFGATPITFQNIYGLDGTQALPALEAPGAFMQLPLALDRDSVVYVFEQLTPEVKSDTLVVTYQRRTVYENRCGFVMKFDSLSVNATTTTYQNLDTNFLDRYEIFINL